MKVLVFGSKSTCSICKGEYAPIEPAIIAGLKAVGAVYTFLDQTAAPAAYAAGKKLVKVSSVPKFPAVFVLDNAGKVKGSFVARSMTAAKIVAACVKLCGDCGETVTPPATTTKPCPTCKGTGTVAVALACALTLFGAGCVMTTGSYKPADAAGVTQPTVHFYRFAVLYPFAVEDVSMPGGVGIKKYGTSGGAAELVPLVDASGKMVGTFMGTAVKAAGAP